MIRLLQFCFLLLFGSATLHAQSGVIGEGRDEARDSLQRWIDGMIPEINNASLLDADSAILIAEEVIRIADQLEYRSGKAQALCRLGFCMDRKSEYQRAIEIYREAAGIQFAIQDSSVGWTISEIGYCQNMLGRRDSAMFYLQKALGIAKEYGLKRDIGLTTFRIANHHLQNRRYGAAMTHLETALEIGRELEDLFIIGQVLGKLFGVYMEVGDLGKAGEYAAEFFQVAHEFGDGRFIASSYRHLGWIQAELGATDSARFLYETGIKKAIEIEDFPRYVGFLSLLGGLDEAAGDLVAAESQYRKELEIARDKGMVGYVARALLNLAELKHNNGNHREAIKLASESLEYAVAVQSMESQERAASVLSRAHKSLGNYATAILYFEESARWEDSSRNEAFVQDLIKRDLSNEFRVQRLSDSLAFAAEQAEADLQLAEQRARGTRQRIALALVAVILLLSLGLGLSVYRGKQASDRLLLNILPKTTADELKLKGRVTPKAIDGVTILFTDFVGFTQIASQLEVNELVAEIDYCFREFDAIMENLGIEKIKTIGDAYLAVGGLSGDPAGSAISVVRAGLLMQDFMRERAESRRDRGLPFFEMRVGVNSGRVAAGVVGTHKFQFDLWGDPVNIAARVESASEAGKVNISSFTRELIGSAFDLEERGIVTVKGGRDVEMYFIKQPQHRTV